MVVHGRREVAVPDVSTVGGLATTVLGHFPGEGESIVWQGHRIEVVDLDGHRIDKLLVTAQARRTAGPLVTGRRSRRLQSSVTFPTPVTSS